MRKKKMKKIKIIKVNQKVDHIPPILLRIKINHIHLEVHLIQEAEVIPLPAVVLVLVEVVILKIQLKEEEMK